MVPFGLLSGANSTVLQPCESVCLALFFSPLLPEGQVKEKNYEKVGEDIEQTTQSYQKNHPAWVEGW
jgi:hypothetical protein